MKKLFTLLVVASAFSTIAIAQNPAEESRRVILGKGGSSTSTDSREVILGRDGRTNETNYPAGTREQQVNQVNREYNSKIQSIRNNPTLTAAEKERMIRQLENDRQRKIRDINRRYNEINRDDRDYKKDKSYKNNNGKKLGWEKGVGNPHRTGSGKEFSYNKNKQNKEVNKGQRSNGNGQAKGKAKGKEKKN